MKYNALKRPLETTKDRYALTLCFKVSSKAPNIGLFSNKTTSSIIWL